MPRVKDVCEDLGGTKYIPVVDVKLFEYWFWSEIDYPVLGINYYDFACPIMGARLVLYKALEDGIHEALGFHGKIVMMSVMPNEMIDNLYHRVSYNMYSVDMKMDVAMTMDTYTYYDVPLSMSWYQTVRAVKFAAEMSKFNVPLIGTIKGAYPDQIEWCIDKLVRMGFRVLAFPCRELIRDKEYDFIKDTVKLAKERRVKILLLGVNSPKLASTLGADYYAGSGWINLAKRGIAYYDKVPMGRVPLERYTPYRCECRFCRGERSRRICLDKRRVAFHNLNYLKEKFKQIRMGWARRAT